MDLVHGDILTYSCQGCRCDACKEAKKMDSRSRRKKKLRLPLAPLEEHMPNEFFVAYKKSIELWREKGLSIYEADRVCTKYGVHPFAVYGTYWYSDMWEKV